MNQFIGNENLRRHCRMVAAAMEAYARERDEVTEEVEVWWVGGLLHDLDWGKIPEKHPPKAVNEILPGEVIRRTLLEPWKHMHPNERYLFACDESCRLISLVPAFGRITYTI